MNIVGERIKQLLDKKNISSQEKELVNNLMKYESVKAKQTFARELRKLNNSKND